MREFHITYEWLREQLAIADGAASIELPGDGMHAVLRAAWNGMGYAPELSAKVSDCVPGENSNWRRHHERQKAYEQHAKRARCKLRPVSDKQKE